MSQTIPLVPAELTVEEARVMQQRQIKKHDVAIVLLHWFNASVWFFELATGLALVVNPDFRVAPNWYTSAMTSAFGAANLLRFHIVLGIVWIVVFCVYGIFGYRNYVCREVVQKEMGLDRDDLQWLRIRTLMLLGKTTEPLPQQGIYNAGQKLFAIMVYVAIPMVAFTGMVMAFHLGGSAMVAWSMLLHFLFVGLVVSGLMIHAYMGAVFPEERPAFFSMITGMVNELYAYKHHYKWWREVKEEQVNWENAMAPKKEVTEPTAGEAKAPANSGN